MSRDELTRRELEVLRLVAEGLSTVQIAERLHISPNTTKNHMTMICVRLRVANRTGAVVAAVRKGLIELEPVREETIALRT